ncbi:hypothetical protein OXPF_33510 [Oxobacter pfennigii]|uniref:DUF5104 domain-containing protein n=1 Tax=Oxobacter pfennigii TaxID=36849 RepID=A0A0P8W3D9_9CLOT|nr:hypothetical protein [Oxobacter pfennigii]KPU43101.1 hypothetical protein OXPF_33510 [Oxobacter pfennigii]
MNRNLCFIFVLSIFLYGCSLDSLNALATQDDLQAASSDTIDVSQRENQPSPSIPANYGSVEALIEIGENFLNAAFEGDVDKMQSFCDEALTNDIERNAEDYLGTKTSYNVDHIETLVKPLDTGKYMIFSEVSAINKNNKTEVFSYYLTAEKAGGNYFIVEYGRTNPSAKALSGNK